MSPLARTKLVMLAKWVLPYLLTYNSRVRIPWIPQIGLYSLGFNSPWDYLLHSLLQVMSQVLLHELTSPRLWGCVRYPPRSWGSRIGDISIYQPTVPQPCRHLMSPVVRTKLVVLAQWSATYLFPPEVSGSTPHGITHSSRRSICV